MNGEAKPGTLDTSRIPTPPTPPEPTAFSFSDAKLGQNPHGELDPASVRGGSIPGLSNANR